MASQSSGLDFSLHDQNIVNIIEVFVVYRSCHPSTVFHCKKKTPGVIVCCVIGRPNLLKALLSVYIVP